MIPTSSAPAAVQTHQFRRCNKCGGTNVFDFSPSTALPCACGGEMFAVAPTVADILAEREHCARGLEGLAARCEENCDAAGNVTAKGAATHMRNLAQWMRTGGVPSK